MANKKVSQLTSKPSVLTTDLFPIADPSTGQLYKTTISDLGTAIGSGVSSVNGLVGSVVLDTDDIQELVSPTNKWFTDTRARAALSASSPLAYNSGTGVFSLPQANGSTNGFLSSADWTTFNNKLSTATAASTYVPYTGATANVDLGLNYSLTAASIIKSGGTSTQFLKADGSIDTNTYLTTSSAASTYVSGSGTTNYLPRWSSSKVLTDSFVYTNGNYTEIQGQGLTASMGIVVSGRYGSVANAPKIYSSDETTGVAHIEFVNGGGEIRLGVEKSTGGQILPGSSAYATVLTAGLSGRNLEFGTNNTKRLTIDGSTGAATFSSSLTIQGNDLDLNNGTVLHRITNDNTNLLIRADYGNSSANSTIRFSIDGGDKMIITSSGNVGIGTTAPNRALVVSGGNMEQLVLISSTTNCGIAFNPSNTSYSPYLGSTGNDLYINTSGSERMRITSVGAVQIGTRSDATESTANLALNNTNYGGFHFLDGTAYYIGQNSNFRSLRMYSGGSTGTGVNLAAGATSWGTYSDERMKTDLMPIENATEKVSQLRSVIGRYKTDEQSKKRSFLIAQDVKEVLPEAISEDLQTGMLEIRYTEVIPLLVASIKELKAELDALKA